MCVIVLVALVCLSHADYKRRLLALLQLEPHVLLLLVEALVGAIAVESCVLERKIGLFWLDFADMALNMDVGNFDLPGLSGPLAHHIKYLILAETLDLYVVQLLLLELFGLDRLEFVLSWGQRGKLHLWCVVL